MAGLSASNVKTTLNCRCWLFSLYPPLKIRIPFSLSEVIPNASFLSDLTNDQNLLIFSCLGKSVSALSFSNVNILESI